MEPGSPDSRDAGTADAASRRRQDLPPPIGPYRIVEKLGEGGFGEVYVAEQAEPVRRTVALKLLKVGMDTKAVLARFEAERQALAIMDHPSIARIFDAGQTESGRPYFAMELVNGKPITAYCDRRQLSVTQRIRLFVSVCHAIQHAHQKGVIHRDLKPSNILVTETEGRVLPKVIDFGIAKATAVSLTENTFYTREGHLVGTPAYMSPEQAETGAVDIDTRSDIYSLGVVLYQLLTGSLPVPMEEIRRAGLAVVARTIREHEPPRPSTRIGSDRTKSAEIARRRSTDPGALKRLLRGDLDWITLKAMEKDRARRYETANALVLDLERHLGNEPVLASPPSFLYRARKFTRRNRVFLSFVTVVFLAITAALLESNRQRIKTDQQRRRAETALGAAEEARAESDAVTTFLTEMLTSADPAQAQGDDVTVREVLDAAATEIETKLAEQPAIQAVVRRAIGSTYLSLGLLDEAETQLTFSLAAFDSLPDRGGDAAATLSDLANIAYERGEYDDAESCFTRAADLLEGLEHREADLASTVEGLGATHWARGDFDAAEPLLRRALELRLELFGERHEEVAASMSNLATLLRSTGEIEEATQFARRAATISEELLGPDHPLLAGHLHNLSMLLLDGGDRDEAERVQRRALAIRRKVLGEHLEVGYSLDALAVILRRGNQLDEAEALLEEALALRRRVLGGDHLSIGTTLHNMAFVLRAKGATDRAIEASRESVDIYRAALGGDHVYLSYPLEMLGSLLLEKENLEEAEACIREARSIRERHLPEGHWRRASIDFLAGKCVAASGDPAAAESLMTDAFSVLEPAVGTPPDLRRSAIEDLAELYEQLGKPDVAEGYRARLDGAGASFD